jgi:hypothetical protein
LSKAQLQQTATIILVVVIFAVALVFLLRAGILTDLVTSFVVAFNSIGTVIRGVLIQSVYTPASVVIGVLSGMLWSSSICHNPIGAVGCGVANGIMIGEIVDGTKTMIESIPLLSMMPPEQYAGIIKRGDNFKVKEIPKADEVKQKIADRIIDCWRMYGSNSYDPFTLKDPPNPRTCFVMQVISDTSFGLGDIKSWMETHEYPSGKECPIVSGTMQCKHSYEDEFNKYSSVKIDDALVDKDIIWDYTTISDIYPDCYDYHTSDNFCDKKIYRSIIFIKYLDYYNALGFITKIESRCYDEDCGYNGDCKTDHDVVVVCGRT